jgi:pro-kumamolisin-like protein/subtilase family protein
MNTAEPVSGHDKTPPISHFVLYAERSIELGRHSHADGNLGVRTTVASSSSASQLTLAEHARARDLYAPSISLAIYAEVGDVFTSALHRVLDIGIGAEHSFPPTMPLLPLARAEGDGCDITVGRYKQLTLTPGSYGTVILLYESELWLASGTYVFASLLMDEQSKLLGTPGEVRLGIVDRMAVARGARVAPQAHYPEARHFQIFVAGDDRSAEPGKRNQLVGTGVASTPAVTVEDDAFLHALLAAPHGTIQVADRVRCKGAFAAFDIRVGDHVCIEFESGFSDSPPNQQGSQQLHGYAGVPDPAQYPLVGPVPNDTIIQLEFGLPVQDSSGLASFITAVSDPKNPKFRQFLTQVEFNSTYGAPPGDYQALQRWAQDDVGFTIVATYPNNLLLTVRATAYLIEQALYTNLIYRRRKDGSIYVTVDRDPSLDLSVSLLEITGLNDYILPYPKGQNGTGGGGLYRAADLRNAYLGVNAANQALDGSGQVVGIIDWAGFKASDITGYAGLQVPAGGQPALPPPKVAIVVSEGGNPPANSALEATLDVEMVLAMAPAAQILVFQGNAGITGHLDNALHAMATSNPPLNVASCSLGFGYSDNSNQALGQMATTGVTFFNASGDNGDIGNKDQANNKFVNQTNVGGSILSANALLSPLPSATYPVPYYAGDATWPNSSGGVMNGVPIPDYQVGVDMSTNGGSTTERNYPDVALPAQGMEVFFQGGTTSSSGTSYAAPLWAGFMALVNQFGAQNGGNGLSGFINPTIYDIGLTRGTANDLYKICFNDIADNVSNGVGGGGGGHTSVAGYDLCTGWGTPNGALINQLSSTTPLVNNQPLSLIRFIVTTGKDNLGGGLHGSSATATVFLPSGATFTLTLRNSSQPNWDAGSVHEVNFPIPATDDSGNPVPPLTEANGLAGVVINLVQHNPDISADNWDIAALQVSLLNPGSPEVCQLNLVGTSVLQDGSTGLVRLSKNSGGSGNGPSSPKFLTGPGSGCT